jgi:hypothetical protein
MAILRSVGASPCTVVGLLTTEAGLLSLDIALLPALRAYRVSFADGIVVRA